MVRLVLSLWIITFTSLGLAQNLLIDPELAPLGLKPQIIKQQPIETDMTIDEDERSPEPLIELAFGKLSKDQFNGLMAFYRNKSKVTYDSNRKYYLSDFLTPQMQALRGLDFNTELTHTEVRGFDAFVYGDEVPEELKDHVRTFGTTAQCWGTAWNNLVSLQNEGLEMSPFQIGYVDIPFVEKYLLSNQYSQRIPEKENLRFGDLMAISAMKPTGEKTPIHFSIYIGFGLIFEKEDSFRGNPYRILPLEMSLLALQKTVDDSWIYKDSKVILEKRRFLDVHQPALPKITRAASAWSKDGFHHMGRLAAKISVYYEEGLGGGSRPAGDIFTRIAFDVDNQGRGVLRENSRKYFSPAFKGQPRCAGSLSN